MTSGAVVLKNIGWLLVGPALRMVLAIALAGFIAHKLGVRGYGELNFASSFVVLFSVVANLGLNETLMRSVARREGQEIGSLLSTALVVKTVLFGVYVGVAVAAAAALGYDTGLVSLIALMAASHAFSSLLLTGWSVASGRQSLRVLTIFHVAHVLIEAALSVVVLNLGAMLFGLTLTRTVVAGVGAVTTLWLTYRSFGIHWARPSPDLMWRLLVSGLSFACISLIKSLEGRTGIIVLQHVRGTEEVGIYSAALAPIDKLFLLLPAIEWAIFPFLSSVQAQDDARFGRSFIRAFRYQSVLAIGSGLAVSVLGPIALRLIFPASFRDAGSVVEIFGIAVALRTMNSLLSSATLARGGERGVSVIASMQAAVSIVGALILARPLGAQGLAWSVVACETVAMIALLRVVHRPSAVHGFTVAPLVKAAAIGGAIAAAVFTMPLGRALVAPVVGVAAYPLLLLGAGLLTTEDLTYFRELVEQQRNTVRGEHASISVHGG